MTKFLKNYTSDVPVNETIHRIEKVLIRCGVIGIMKEYAPDAAVQAMVFQLETPSGRVSIRLPADTQAALDAMWLDYVGDDMLSTDKKYILGNRAKKKRRCDFAEQASRTAWKIMQDWVEVQMSMIQLKQAEPLQVFLPYVMVNGTQNFYQRSIECGIKNLIPEHV